jgi:hypothetical protein
MLTGDFVVSVSNVFSDFFKSGCANFSGANFFDVVSEVVFEAVAKGEHLKVAKIDQSPQNKGLSHTSKA